MSMLYGSTDNELSTEYERGYLSKKNNWKNLNSIYENINSYMKYR